MDKGRLGPHKDLTDSPYSCPVFLLEKTKRTKTQQFRHNGLTSLGRVQGNPKQYGVMFCWRFFMFPCLISHTHFINVCYEEKYTLHILWFEMKLTHKWQLYDHFWPFFAICIFIFHKTEVQAVILRCLTGLNLDWVKSCGLRCSLMPVQVWWTPKK